MTTKIYPHSLEFALFVELDGNSGYEGKNRFINTPKGTCRRFFKLSIIGFDGPAAHIAMMLSLGARLD